jgi:hypothetical protein
LYLVLPVSLDCPFLVAPSVASVSGLSIPGCQCLWIVHSWLPLRFYLSFIVILFCYLYVLYCSHFNHTCTFVYYPIVSSSIEIVPLSRII